MDAGYFTLTVARLLKMAGYTSICGTDRTTRQNKDWILLAQINDKLVMGRMTQEGFEVRRILSDGLYRYGTATDLQEAVQAMREAAQPLHEVQVWAEEIGDYIWVSRTYDSLQAHQEALDCGRARVVIR